MAWTPVVKVWTGGSAEAKPLTGKRVRTTEALSFPEFLGADRDLGITVSVKKGAIGIVGYPVKDQIVIAFPKDDKTVVTSLEALVRSGNTVSQLATWETFKHHFEIET